MEGHRVSLATLMAVVLVAAINLAAGRAFLPRLGPMGWVIGLSGLALQIGLFGLIRKRGQDRVFWAGFVAAGSLALMTFVWEESVPNNKTPFGSPWLTYMLLIDNIMPSLSFRTPPGGWPATRLAVNAVVLVLPQLFIALAGGLLFRGIATRRSIASAHV